MRRITSGRFADICGIASKNFESGYRRRQLSFPSFKIHNPPLIHLGNRNRPSGTVLYLYVLDLVVLGAYSAAVKISDYR